MSEPILAIDPGPKESAWCYWDGRHVVAACEENDALRHKLRRGRFVSEQYHLPGLLAVEQVCSYGMSVGEEVFTTVWWSGRFVEAWGGRFLMVPRLEVKMRLCHDSRARDSNIRTALIDRFGGDSVALAKPRRCEACRGKGQEKSTRECGTCGGGGRVGTDRGSKACPTCRGQRHIPILIPCPGCGATGRVGADGPLRGISGHCWAALAVAVTAQGGLP